MLFYLCLFTISIVLAIKIATHEKMVLHNFKKSIAPHLGKWKDNIIECEWCMPSIYSMFGYLFTYIYLGELPLKIFLLYPIVVGISSFISGTLWTIALILLKVYENNKD